MSSFVTGYHGFVGARLSEPMNSEKLSNSKPKKGENLSAVTHTSKLILAIGQLRHGLEGGKTTG